MSFAATVYRKLLLVPRGRVTTYGALACAVGAPRAARAVGAVLHQNPTPLQIPCHRVVHADGKIGGYVHGVRQKRALLRREGIRFDHGRVRSPYVITIF